MLSRRKHGWLMLWTIVAMLILIVVALAEPQIISLLNPFSNISDGTWVVNFTTSGRGDISFSLGGDLFCQANQSDFANYTCPYVSSFVTEVGYGDYTMGIVFGNSSAVARGVYPEPKALLEPAGADQTNATDAQPTNATPVVNETCNETTLNETTSDETVFNATAQPANETDVNETISNATAFNDTLSNKTAANDTSITDINETVELPEAPESASLQDALSPSLSGQVRILGDKRMELLPNSTPVKSILFSNVNVSKGLRLGLDEVPVEKVKEKDFVRVYAIDPSQMEFDYAVVTVRATGTELYKCKDWDFDKQECLGDWELFMTGLVPGGEYTFVLEPDDPGFGEIIVTRALHLDGNRAFVSDIYEDVRELDGDWSETIPDGHYVRVTFHKELTKRNDITIYPRVMAGDPAITVYEAGESEPIAEFEEIDSDEYNEVILRGLEGSQDTFDLHITDGDVRFDHIVDPPILIPLNLTPNPAVGGSNVTVYGNVNDAGSPVVNNTIWIYLDEVMLNDTILVGDNVHSPSWWNYTWRRRKKIELKETEGTAREREPVIMNVSGLTISNCTNELRLINSSDEEVKIEVLRYNLTASQGSRWCKFTFIENMSASSTEIMYLYYDDSDASDPGYGSIVLHYDDFETRTLGDTLNSDSTGYSTGYYSLWGLSANHVGRVNATETGNKVYWLGCNASSGCTGSWPTIALMGGYYESMGDFTVDVMIKRLDNPGDDAGETGVTFRYENSGSCYDTYHTWFDSSYTTFYLWKKWGNPGSCTEDTSMDSNSYSTTTGVWYHLQVKSIGSDHRSIANYGASTLSGTDSHNPTGTVRLDAWTKASSLFDNWTVWKGGVNISDVKIAQSVSNESYYLQTDSSGDYNYTFTAPYTEGNHTVKVNSTVNPTGENSTNLTIQDSTAPDVDWNWTDANSTTAYNSSTICVNLSESGNCTLHFNRTDYVNTSSGTNICWNQSNLPDGNYSIINATCEDSLGNAANSTNAWWRVLYQDSTPPDMEWNWTHINSTISVPYTNICVNLSESGNCTLHFNSTDYVNTSSGTHICWMQSSLDNGNYSTINATCEDAVENGANSTNAWVNVSVVDNTSPNVTIVAPAADHCYCNHMTINASAADTSGVSTVYYRLSNFSGNVTSWTPMSLNSGSIYDGYWNATHDTTSLGYGDYNLTINATDIRSNTNATESNEFNLPSKIVWVDRDSSGSDSINDTISISNTHVNLTFRFQNLNTGTTSDNGYSIDTLTYDGEVLLENTPYYNQDELYADISKTNWLFGLTTIMGDQDDPDVFQTLWTAKKTYQNLHQNHSIVSEGCVLNLSTESRSMPAYITGSQTLGTQTNFTLYENNTLHIVDTVINKGGSATDITRLITLPAQKLITTFFSEPENRNNNPHGPNYIRGVTPVAYSDNYILYAKNYGSNSYGSGTLEIDDNTGDNPPWGPERAVFVPALYVFNTTQSIPSNGESTISLDLVVETTNISTYYDNYFSDNNVTFDDFDYNEVRDHFTDSSVLEDCFHADGFVISAYYSQRNDPPVGPSDWNNLLISKSLMTMFYDTGNTYYLNRSKEHNIYLNSTLRHLDDTNWKYGYFKDATRPGVMVPPNDDWKKNVTAYMWSQPHQIAGLMAEYMYTKNQTTLGVIQDNIKNIYSSRVSGSYGGLWNQTSYRWKWLIQDSGGRNTVDQDVYDSQIFGINVMLQAYMFTNNQSYLNRATSVAENYTYFFTRPIWIHEDTRKVNSFNLEAFTAKTLYLLYDITGNETYKTWANDIIDNVVYSSIYMDRFPEEYSWLKGGTGRMSHDWQNPGVPDSNGDSGGFAEYNMMPWTAEALLAAYKHTGEEKYLNYTKQLLWHIVRSNARNESGVRVVDYFENSNVTWTASDATQTVDFNTSNKMRDSKSLEWNFTQGGSDNNLKYITRAVTGSGGDGFADWDRFDNLTFWFYTTQTTPNYYLSIKNSGSWVLDKYDFHTQLSSGWSLVEVDISGISRGSVEAVNFSIDGNDFGAATYTFLIDDLAIRNNTRNSNISSEYNAYTDRWYDFNNGQTIVANLIAVAELNTFLNGSRVEQSELLLLDEGDHLLLLNPYYNYTFNASLHLKRAFSHVWNANTSVLQSFDSATGNVTINATDYVYILNATFTLDEIDNITKLWDEADNLADASVDIYVVSSLKTPSTLNISIDSLAGSNITLNTTTFNMSFEPDTFTYTSHSGNFNVPVISACGTPPCHTYVQDGSSYNITIYNLTIEPGTGSNNITATGTDSTPPTLGWNWTDVNSTTTYNSTTICVNSTEDVNCTLFFNGTAYPNATTGVNICWNQTNLANGNYSTINATCDDASSNEANTSNAWWYANYTNPTELSEPAELDQNNTEYTVVDNITATEIAFNITGENVTLNCGGYRLKGAGMAIIAINVTGKGAIIRNCYLEDFVSSAVLVSAANAAIRNITVDDPYCGLNITVDNTTVINSTINNNTIGIAAEDVINITISNNTIWNNSDYGIRFTNANSSTIDDNDLKTQHSDTTYAIHLTDSDSDTIANNTIEWNATGASKDSYGLYMKVNSGKTGGSNIITNNTLVVYSASSNAYGVYLFTDDTSNSNTIQNNTFNINAGSSASGVSLNSMATSNSNTIQDNTFNINASSYAYGVELVSYGTSMDSNTVSNNTLDIDSTSSYAYGAHLYNGGTSMDSNTVSSNSFDLNASSSAYGVYLENQGTSMDSTTISNEKINVTSTASLSAFSVYGIYFSNADYTNVTQNTLNATAPTALSAGIYLQTGSDFGDFWDNTVTGGNYSLYIASAGGDGNTFWNNTFQSAYNTEINDSSGASDTNYFHYQNSHGIINWTSTSFRQNLTTKGTLQLGNTINITNNSVVMSATAFTSPWDGINSSANITLYELDEWGFTDPVIKRNGVICNDTTTPKCHNYTALDAAIVIFNVSTWSNYSIGERNTAPQISLVSPGDDSANNDPTSLSLNVTVTDPEGDNMTVVFYGDQITGFVNATGLNFTINGSRFRFMGTNAYYIWDYATNTSWDDDDNEITGSRQYVTEILDEAQDLGFNVIRTWAFGSANSSHHVNRYEVPSPGNYNETVFQALDWVVWQASRRGIRLMLVFVNNWDAYGGMKWYVQHSPTTNKGLSGDDFHDQFYNDVNCIEYYENYTRNLMNRTNTYTGIKYKDDPTIFAWSLGNEPRAKSDGDRSNGLMLEWIENMSSFVKGIDSNHMLTAGIEGWGTPWEGTAFIIDHDVADIDFASYALYPDSWSWFGQWSEYPNATYVGTAVNAESIKWWTNMSSDLTWDRWNAYEPEYGRFGYQNWVRQHVNWSNLNLTRPVMIQEFGLDNDSENWLRSRFYNETIDTFFTYGGDGILFWNHNHEGYFNSTDPDGVMADGYDFYVTTNETLHNRSLPVLKAINYTKQSNGGGSWIDVPQYIELCRFENVTSGSTVNCTWNSGLAYSMDYDWYVEASDASLTTNSSIWNFSTLDVSDATPLSIDWNWTDINSTTNTNSTTICVNASEAVNCTLYFNGTAYANGTSATNICWNFTNMGVGNYSTINSTCDDSTINQANTTNAWWKVILFNQLVDCGTLDQENTTYTLLNNVTTDGTCFNITANNVTLDCQSWSNDIVYGNQSGGSYYGAYSEQDYTTIRNCQISTNYKTDTRAGIYLYTGGGDKTGSIIDNVNSSNSREGVYIRSQNNAVLKNIVANDNDQPGVYLRSLENATLTNITALRNGYYGLYLRTSANNVSVENITSSYNTYHGIFCNTGSCQGCSFTNIEMLNNSNKGIVIIGGYNNTFSNAVINDTAKNGILLSATYDNVFENVSIYNSSEDGIDITGATSGENNFTNVTVSTTKSGYSDIYVGQDATITYFIDTHLGSYNITQNGSLVYFRDATQGEIQFFQAVNGTGSSLNADINSIVYIGNNTVTVDTVTAPEFDKPANITLYELDEWGFSNPVILRNGAVCDDTTTPSCHNFTALDAAVVIFNVSGWSNYTIGEDPTPRVYDVTVGNGGVYNPTQGSTTQVNVTMNVTDSDGWEDVNWTNSYCNVTKGSRVVNLSSCTNLTNSSSTTVAIACTGYMQYYYLTGNDWEVNCTAFDDGGASASNLSATNMTYNRLESINVSQTSIAWSGITQSSVDEPSDDNPIVIWNLGNAYFASLNITSYELAGAIDPSEEIAASDFSANEVDASEGEQLANATAVTVNGASLLIGEDSIENAYAYLEQVSNSPLEKQSYSSVSPWELMVYGAGNTNP